MTTHVVIANKGAVSAPMSYRRALNYANRLRILGNYHVSVTGVKHVSNNQS